MTRELRALLMEYACWLCIGVAAFALSFGFDDEIALYRYGANTWPAVIACGLMCCATILFFFDIYSKNYLKDTQIADSELSLRSMWPIFLIPISYVFCIEYIGFYVCTILFLPLYSCIMTRMSILKNVIISLPISIIIIIVFTKFLFVPFPVGKIHIFYTINSEIVNILY